MRKYLVLFLTLLIHLAGTGCAPPEEPQKPPGSGEASLEFPCSEDYIWEFNRLVSRYNVARRYAEDIRSGDEEKKLLLRENCHYLIEAAKDFESEFGGTTCDAFQDGKPDPVRIETNYAVDTFIEKATQLLEEFEGEFEEE